MRLLIHSAYNGSDCCNVNLSMFVLGQQMLVNSAHWIVTR